VNVARLEELVSLSSGEFLPKQRFNKDGLYPVLGSNGEIGRTNEFNHEGPVITIGRVGACGAINYYTGKSWITDNALIATPNPQIAQEYLLFYLRSVNFDLLRSGTSQPLITQTRLKALKVPVPPILAQKEIAAILEKADHARRKRRETLRLTDQFLQAAFLQMFGELVTNRKGWRVDTIRSVVEKVQNISSSSFPTKEITYVDISSIDNVHKRVKRLSRLSGNEIPSRARQIIQEGDILVSTVRPNLNAVAIVPAGLNNPIGSTGFCVLRVNKKAAVKEYLSEICKSNLFVQKLSKIAKGASYPAVSDNDILDLKILVPPLSEQRKFASMMEKIETLRETQRQSEQELETLFQSMMQKAFSGELVM
jgi:type I restriction enzyme S subunit